MPAELQTCNMQVLFYSAICILGTLSLIIGIKFLLKIPGLIRYLKGGQEKPAEENDQVAELRNTTFQISEEWAEIKRLIVKQPSSAASRLDSNLKTLGDELQTSLKASLDEECRRNDQRFAQLHSKVCGFREGFDGVRDMLKKYEEVMDRMPRVPITDAWTHTECELLDKIQQEPEDDAVEEQGSPRSIVTVIKQALIEFLKEAKHQMSIQRNEVMLDLKSVFEQLSEDKENLQNTIEGAFSTASHQTHASFLQFGNVGRDAMKCIAVLNENTERTLVTKFQESGEKLQGILEVMKNLNFDVSCVKQTLENIDGQFDEIYKKLELECQNNADYSEEIVKSLQRAVQEWNEKSSSMDQMCNQLTCATHSIKDSLVTLDNVLCNRPACTTDTIPYSLSNSQCMLNQNLSISELESGNIGDMFTTVQICQDKLASMRDYIDQNTCEVQQSNELLMDDLQLLTTLVKNSVETLKSLDIKIPDPEDQLEKNCRQEQRGFCGDVLDTITEYSEMTEESQDYTGLQTSKLKKSSEVSDLLQIIDKNLDMARHTSIDGITKNSEFFDKASK